jgi:signal peptidase II
MMRRYITKLVLLALVTTTIGCDQVSKHLATAHLMGGPTRSYFGDSLRLQYAQNTGGFLSLGAKLPPGVRTALFSVGTALLLGACVVVILRIRRPTPLTLGLTLVVAGGVSNLWDRLTHGAVTDFLNLGLGPLRTGIFNIADMAIMTGITLVLLSSGFGRRKSHNTAGE